MAKRHGRALTSIGRQVGDRCLRFPSGHSINDSRLWNRFIHVEHVLYHDPPSGVSQNSKQRVRWQVRRVSSLTGECTVIGIVITGQQLCRTDRRHTCKQTNERQILSHIIAWLRADIIDKWF